MSSARAWPNPAPRPFDAYSVSWNGEAGAVVTVGAPVPATAPPPPVPATTCVTVTNAVVFGGGYSQIRAAWDGALRDSSMLGDSVLSWVYPYPTNPDALDGSWHIQNPTFSEPPTGVQPNRVLKPGVWTPLEWRPTAQNLASHRGIILQIEGVAKVDGAYGFAILGPWWAWRHRHDVHH